jgi:hypothetical protein
MGLDAGQQIGALPDEEGALAQERAQGPFVGGIDVGRADEVGAQQVGEFFRIDPSSAVACYGGWMRSFLFLPPWMART